MEYSASVNPKRVLPHEGNIMEHTCSSPLIAKTIVNPFHKQLQVP